jgi:GNAT superfamily N-acetyltransferase
VELSNRQVEYYKRKFIPILHPDFFYAVMDENERMVGFILAMPSLSRAMQKTGGRLLPLGFIHIWKALKKPGKIDFLLVGVLPEYQNKGIYAVLMNCVTRSSIDYRLQGAETNGMLEDNFRVLNFNRYFEAHMTKRKRVYRKNLSN